jgi:hypothetical protein
MGGCGDSRSDIQVLQRLITPMTATDPEPTQCLGGFIAGYGRDRESWPRYLSQKPDGISAKRVFRLRSVCLTSHVPIPWISAALHGPFVPGTLRAPTSSPLPRSARLPDSSSAELPLVLVHLRGRRPVANDLLGRCPLAWLSAARGVQGVCGGSSADAPWHERCGCRESPVTLWLKRYECRTSYVNNAVPAACTPEQRVRCSQRPRGYDATRALAFARGSISRSTSCRVVSPPIVLSLSRSRPSRAGQPDTRTREARGAEAPAPANGRESAAAKS